MVMVTSVAIFIFSIFMLLSVGFLLLSPFLVRFCMLFRSFFYAFSLLCADFRHSDC